MSHHPPSLSHIFQKAMLFFWLLRLSCDWGRFLTTNTAYYNRDCDNPSESTQQGSTLGRAVVFDSRTGENFQASNADEMLLLKEMSAQ